MVYSHAFIKDAIQRDVKENERKEIGEEVEDDSRHHLSATGQDREFELEKVVEGEANHGVDDAVLMTLAAVIAGI